MKSIKRQKSNIKLGEENYKMKELFEADQLVVGKLEYISNEVTDFGPKCIKSQQVYLFEPIIIDSKIRYREVFTGFIAGDGTEKLFDLP